MDHVAHSPPWGQLLCHSNISYAGSYSWIWVQWSHEMKSQESHVPLNIFFWEIFWSVTSALIQWIIVQSMIPVYVVGIYIYASDGRFFRLKESFKWFSQSVKMYELLGWHKYKWTYQIWTSRAVVEREENLQVQVTACNVRRASLSIVREFGIIWFRILGLQLPLL